MIRDMFLEGDVPHSMAIQDLKVYAQISVAFIAVGQASNE